MILSGLESFLSGHTDLASGKRIGLVTNHTGLNSRLHNNTDLLQEAGVNLTALFGPEHGIRGEVADGEKVESADGSENQIPVYSLFGQNTKPTPKMLENVDVLLFDIQDVGARFYTYLYTMSNSMEAAGEKGIPFIVLDRPNPIGGLEIEGTVLEPSFKSFVGLHPIPNRTGITVGELAILFQKEFHINVDLTVVPMEGWRRDMWFDETGLPWIMPSPNMPTLETAIVYPGNCLFEGTNLSEGRGTTHPFEIIGAPWTDGRKLAEKMNEMNFPGVLFREIFFKPTASKHQGESCYGIQFHIMDRNRYKPVRTAIYLLQTLLQLYPNHFEWRVFTPGEHYSIDNLCGTNQVRLQLSKGIDAQSIIDSWQPKLDEYNKIRSKYYLYH